MGPLGNNSHHAIYFTPWFVAILRHQPLDVLLRLLVMTDKWFLTSYFVMIRLNGVNRGSVAILIFSWPLFMLFAKLSNFLLLTKSRPWFLESRLFALQAQVWPRFLVLFLLWLGVCPCQCRRLVFREFHAWIGIKQLIMQWFSLGTLWIFRYWITDNLYARHLLLVLGALDVARDVLDV